MKVRYLKRILWDRLVLAAICWCIGCLLIITSTVYFTFLLSILVAFLGVFIAAPALFCMKSIKVDEAGLYSRVLRNPGSGFLSWKKIRDWGIGQDSLNILRCQKLFTGRKGSRAGNGLQAERFIYFSRYELTDKEKKHVFRSQLFKHGLIAVEYDQSLYEYAASFLSAGDLSASVKKTEETEAEKIEVKVDFAGSIQYWVAFIFCLWCFGFFFADWYMGTKYQNLCISGITLFMLWLASLFPEYCGKLKIDKQGLSCKHLGRKEKQWKWEEVSDCGVVRSWRTGFRYIYFSKEVLDDNKDFLTDSFYRKQFKREDLIVVRYTDKLYCYLEKISALDISRHW